MRNRFLLWMSLFTSTSTLFCCALPALFVLLGLGASFAGLTANFPQLLWLSENKEWTFLFGGIMLSLGFVLPRVVSSTENIACKVGPDGSSACSTTGAWSQKLWFVSAGLYSMGFFFAYIAPWLPT